MGEAKIIKPNKGFQEKFVRSNVDFVVGGGVLNCGKALPINELVVTPNGYVRMGDVKEGDVISGFNGNKQTILKVYERGLLDCIRFTFDDFTTVKCCPEHLWDVYDTILRKNIVIEAGEIIKRGINRYKIQPCGMIGFNPKKALPIEPYLMGLLLGDACMGGDNISVTITTDKECIDRAYNIHPFEYTYVSCSNKPDYVRITDKKIRLLLKENGLLGTRSDTKFILEEYKYASIKDRWSLVNGLFDTDGYNDKRSGRAEYCTVSKQLSDDVCFILRSLGIKVKVLTKIGAYRDKDNNIVKCKKAYRLLCRYKEIDKLFTLSRKKNNKIGKRDVYINFSKYELLDKEEMRCITVSNEDHKFLTNDFIPTHNSFAALLALAEPQNDPNFSAVFLRNNLGDLKAGGGLIQEAKRLYGDSVTVTESGDPRMVFRKSGAKVDLTHIADQSKKAVEQRFKGRQYDLIYFDEGTGFTWECFKTVCTRNRGSASWTNKIRMTTNPKKSHWLRKFLDWYIGADGYIIEERDGIVRYFFMNGDKVEDVVFGMSKKEVYEQCKTKIDRLLAKVNGKDGKQSWEDLIMSTTFYLGRMSENVQSLENNKGYLASVAMGGRDADINLEGNWNVDPEEETDIPISSYAANDIFNGDPKINNDWWITADLATDGKDNFVALVWNGLHIVDIKICGNSTPRQNSEMLKELAIKYDIGFSHIIYDGVNGQYMQDYIAEAQPFYSCYRAVGLDRFSTVTLKDECYKRLCWLINKSCISFSEEVAKRRYVHQKLKNDVSVQCEFVDECTAVRFRDFNGKKKLWSKKEMNALLGNGRSMDLLDPIAMRLMPLLEYEFGRELEMTLMVQEQGDINNNNLRNSFYGDSDFGIFNNVMNEQYG